MGIEVSGLLGLIVLALDIWAILSIADSTSSTGKKVVWILLIVILPLLGVVVWLLFGPRKRRRVPG